MSSEVSHGVIGINEIDLSIPAYSCLFYSQLLMY